MFGRKDPMKEFEQMRQALKPAERYASRSDADTETGDDPVLSQPDRSPEPMVSPPAREPRSDPAEDHDASVVSIGSTWQGNLKVDGSVRIEGQMTGEIEAKGTVFVVEGAQVDAKVRAALVIIAGDFKGEVNCTERLEIRPTGRVKADMNTKALMIHEGAFIEGQIHMSRSEAPAGPHPVPGDTQAKPLPKNGSTLKPVVALPASAN